VEVAASAEEGLERCREHDFDLVVLDYWLPGLTGLEVARRLREGGCTTRIVIFSACVDPELAVAGREVDARVIDKLDWKELVRVCGDVAGARAARAQFAVRHR
jgi:DNA-binding response OmpR family regulator